MRFRVKSSSVTKVIEVDGKLSDLLAELRKNELCSVADVSIKYGFPPKNVAMEDTSKTLQEVGLRSGEQLILETGSGSTRTSNAQASATKTSGSGPKDIPSVFNPAFNEYTILRNVPDDNSCMFNSIIYALNNTRDASSVYAEVQKLRKIVSGSVRSNPDLYSEVVLGRTNEQYSDWISKKDSWGGAIELGILSNKLETNFFCLDVETGAYIKFETERSNRFVVLVYSGIHYDVMASNRELSVAAQAKVHDQCVFEKNTARGDSFLEDCLRVCKLLQTENYSTNTTKFRVRCLECYEVLVGEMGASNHANSTGHFKFGEVK